MMLKEQLNLMNTFRENLMNHPDLPETSVIQAIAAFMELSELDTRACLAFIHEYHGQRFDQAEDFIRDWLVCGFFWEAQELEDYMNEGQTTFIPLQDILAHTTEFVQLPSGRILSWNH